MDAKTYHKTYGPDASRRIAEKIGMDWENYRYYLHGKKPRIPTRKVAWRMHWASGGQMTLDGLLPPAEGDDASQYQ